MSKASQLGAGRFGSSAAAPVSARRQAVAAATGVPTDGIAPPTRLPVGKVSPNPDNPRSSLGDLAELAASMKEHGQKQPIVVMNRDAYVKANPAHETELEPDTTHVVIDGSSRLAAAREAGLPHIQVWVNDEQGGTSEELLESALVANIHRRDLSPLDEAHALQRLLALHDNSQSALARRLHKSQGWISQRLALLSLKPELQERIGSENIKHLRAVGNKPEAEQEAALEKLKQKDAAARDAEKQVRQAAQQATAQEAPASAPAQTRAVAEPEPVRAEVTVPQNPVGEHHTHSSLTGTSAAPGSAGPAEAAAQAGDGQVPEPRTNAADEERRETCAECRARRLRFDDPTHIGMLVAQRMDKEHFLELVRLVNARARVLYPEDYEDFVQAAVSGPAGPA
ncbi:ParB/RepB/Spo0J family partition protein [Streptomyces sp. NPDC093094]|uniref:ParB/RepB/Spo0J family partition protein n=1 Tax=Streptomyces sp. NPDC093094 TaxID=3366026 RepID=UPI0037FA37CF